MYSRGEHKTHFLEPDEFRVVVPQLFCLEEAEFYLTSFPQFSSQDRRPAQDRAAAFFGSRSCYPVRRLRFKVYERDDSAPVG